jgi:hypothetical protein
MITYKDETFTVVWNESATFNVYDNETKENVDCFTVYDCSPQQAHDFSYEHITEYYKG